MFFSVHVVFPDCECTHLCLSQCDFNAPESDDVLISYHDIIPGVLGEVDLAAQHVMAEIGAITYMVWIISTIIQYIQGLRQFQGRLSKWRWGNITSVIERLNNRVVVEEIRFMGGFFPSWKLMKYLKKYHFWSTQSLNMLNSNMRQPDTDWIEVKFWFNRGFVC